MLLSSTMGRPDWWYLLVVVPFPLFAWLVSTKLGAPLARLSVPRSNKPDIAKRQRKTEQIALVITVILFSIAGIVVGVVLAYKS
jgi:hypothetical protein